MTRINTFSTPQIVGIMILAVVALLVGTACQRPLQPSPTRSAPETVTPAIPERKLETALRQRLLFADPDERIAVTIVVATRQSRTEPELFAELGRIFPEVQAALERSGDPFDVEGYDRSNEIEAAYVQLLEDDRRAQTHAVRAYLDSEGVKWWEGSHAADIMPLLTPAQIFRVAARGDVAAIVLTDRPTPRPTVTFEIGPREQLLSWRTIELAEYSRTGQYYDQQAPTLFVVTSPADISTFEAYLTPDSITDLGQLDYVNAMALGLVQGQKPSGSHSVEIQLITWQDRIVSIYARFNEPQPGREAADMITSPYHVVTVERPRELRGSITFQIYSGNTLLFETMVQQED